MATPSLSGPPTCICIPTRGCPPILPQQLHQLQGVQKRSREIPLWCPWRDWYNDLKDAKTFYMKVNALDIISLLDAYSGGLHAVDMISLCSNMTQYYVQADDTPQFICENIPRWISLFCDSAFAHKKEFSIFKFSERFSKISWTKTSFIDFFVFIDSFDTLLALSESFAMLVFEAQPAILTVYQTQRL
jgi:hypothetical protein